MDPLARQIRSSGAQQTLAADLAECLLLTLKRLATIRSVDYAINGKILIKD
jgi:hypothetical protein